jgi:PIN domain nuclease of toxin-antitoxin system
MRYLLDSNALIWSLIEPSKLKPQVQDILADADNEVAVSIASLWEIVIKQSNGKLKLPESFVADIELVGYKIIGLNVSYLEAYASLPNIHKDPFDRMLIASASCENMKIITSDRVFHQYDVGVIEAI